MGRCLLVVGLMSGACSAELMDPPGNNPNVDAPPGSTSDASVDSSADAFVLGAWGTPAKVPGASSGTLEEDDASLSSTGLEMIFSVANAADGNRKDLYLATRTSTTVPFQTPAKLPFSLTGSSEETPRFSPDDKTVYFASDRAGGQGGLDIYRVSRTAVGGAWGTVAPVAGPNTAANEKWFMPCQQNTSYLVIVGGDIHAGVVNGAAPTVVAELSAAGANETGPFLTSDCLTTYFASVRSGTNAIYSSHRTSLGTAWQAPTMFIDFAAVGGAQEDPWIAADGRTFVFVSNVTTKDVYISTR